MLQDDGHLAGVAVPQSLGNVAVRMVGAESDVEVVVAWQAVPRHMDQGPPHHAAQRIFDHAIVAQAALARFLGHVTSSPAPCYCRCRGYCSLWPPSGALLLPGAPRTPPKPVTVQDLTLAYPTAIKRRGEPHCS